MPRSALPSTTLEESVVRFSASGSGLCGNSPLGTQYSSSMATTPNAFNSCGTTMPPVEFTASTTTLKPRSEEHTSELQSLMRISYAVFCLKKKKTQQNNKQFKYNQ